MPTVYCVIPVHNRLDITKQCLEYLSVQDYPQLVVIVVNDGSTDGTSEYLAQARYSNLTVLTGDGNCWWGGAMHMGIEYVSKIARKDDYLLMLNDDVRVEWNYVTALVDESAANNNAIVGSTQCDENTGSAMGSSYLINYWQMRLLTVEKQGQHESLDALPGRGALFPMRSVLQTGNINDKAFRHYWGDVEYSARARDAGWKIVISKQARVYTSPNSSDSDARGKGVLKQYFSGRSKSNLIQRLWFYTLRGPYWLRLWAIPRYIWMGGCRWILRKYV